MRTIDDIYVSIAQFLSNCIDEDWVSASLEVERVSDDAIKFSGSYKSVTGEQKYFRVKLNPELWNRPKGRKIS